MLWQIYKEEGKRMSINLRFILLAIAILFVMGIVIESVRRRRTMKAREVTINECQAKASAKANYDDAILGPVRVISDKEIASTPAFSKTSQKTPAEIAPVSIDTPYLQKATENELIVLYVMATPNQTFSAGLLNDTLTQAGFEFSNMKIFNYYQTEQDKKELMFCLASAFEPGTFDFENTSSTPCAGLCFFMSAKHRHATVAFNSMLQQAEQLTYKFNAVLCDNKHQPCTRDYVDACHKRIAMH